MRQKRLNWRDVPAAVADLHKVAVVLTAIARQAAMQDPEQPVGADYISGYAYTTSKKAAGRAIRHVSEIPSECVVFKLASVGDVLRPINSLVHEAGKVIGGPNTLTNTLLGGAVLGGAGYGLGALYDEYIQPQIAEYYPESWRGRSKMRKLLGIGGAALGAAPGVLQGATQLINRKSLLSNFPYHDKVGSADSDLFVPSIPVDAFNRVVWGSAIQPQNAFGTRSGWGDNSGSMQAPPAAAAAITGLVQAAAGGRDWVSPWDIAKTTASIGAAAGLGGLGGLATGLFVGKTLGAVAGLSESAQRELARSGALAGVITGVASKVFK